MNKENKVKFECGDCGVYYWVEDRNNFKCPNCEDKLNDETMQELTGLTDKEYNKKLNSIIREDKNKNGI